MITSTVIFILICAAIYAFLAGMETGITSIHKLRLKHFVKKGTRGADILEYYVEDVDRFLGPTLVGQNICVVIISIAVANLAVKLPHELLTAMASPVTSVFIIIFCEYMPKAWFQSRPIERSLRFAELMRLFDWILRPFTIIILLLARILLPSKSGRKFGTPPPFVTREDLKLLAREGEKDGVLSSKERYMIHRVIELSNRDVRSIMIPPNQIIAVYGDTNIQDFCKLAKSTGLTRFPVLDKKTGKYTGIVNTFYVLGVGVKLRDRRSVADFARLPQFIDANMKADRVLPLMRRARQPLCLVREGNSVIGLVSTEDILRIIVGKL